MEEGDWGSSIKKKQKKKMGSSVYTMTLFWLVYIVVTVIVILKQSMNEITREGTCVKTDRLHLYPHKSRYLFLGSLKVIV